MSSIINKYIIIIWSYLLRISADLCVSYTRHSVARPSINEFGQKTMKLG